jgi:hypothetical protein
MATGPTEIHTEVPGNLNNTDKLYQVDGEEEGMSLRDGCTSYLLLMEGTKSWVHRLITVPMQAVVF